MWEKAEHAVPSLPTESQSYINRKKNHWIQHWHLQKSNTKCYWASTIAFCIYFTKMFRWPAVAQLSQRSQLCAGGAEPEGTRKVPPQQVWGHCTARCPGDPLSLGMRRTTVSHQIIVGSSMFSQVVGLCGQPRILWLGNATAQATACSAVAFLDDKVKIAGNEPIATSGEMHFWDVMVITGTGNFLYFYCYSFLLLFCFIIPSFYWLWQSAFSLHSFNIFHTSIRLENKLKNNCNILLFNLSPLARTAKYSNTVMETDNP